MEIVGAIVLLAFAVVAYRQIPAESPEIIAARKHFGAL